MAQLTPEQRTRVTSRAAQVVVNDDGHAWLPPGLAVDVGEPGQVDDVHRQVADGGLGAIEPLEDKPWGIRRFSFLDPNGERITVLAHTAG